MLGRFLESGNVHVTDAGLDHEMQVHAVARNLVADDGEFERLVGTFAQHRDANGGAFRSLEQIGNVGGAHVVGGLAVDGGNKDRKSTRLNSSHQIISYAVFCLKKKKT